MAEQALKDKPCRECGTMMLQVSPCKRFCDDCRRKHKSACDRRRKNSPERIESRRAYSRDYYWEHRDEILAKQKAFRKTEEGRAEAERMNARRREIDPATGHSYGAGYQSKYYESHKAEIREKWKLNYSENRDEVLAYGRAAGARFREKRRLVKKAAAGSVEASIELQRMAGKLKTCARLRLTAMELPCGKLEVCHGCENAPKTKFRRRFFTA